MGHCGSRKVCLQLMLVFFQRSGIAGIFADLSLSLFYKIDSSFNFLRNMLISMLSKSADASTIWVTICVSNNG